MRSSRPANPRLLPSRSWEEVKEYGLSVNALIGFLHDLGKQRDKLTAYMRRFIGPDDNIIFDGTDQLSASRPMDYAPLTKTKKGISIQRTTSCGCQAASGICRYITASCPALSKM